MASAVGGILPLGIGVAISPVPIIAMILMLLSRQAKGNGLAFALGWARPPLIAPIRCLHEAVIRR